MQSYIPNTIDQSTHNRHNPNAIFPTLLGTLLAQRGGSRLYYAHCAKLCNLIIQIQSTNPHTINTIHFGTNVWHKGGVGNNTSCAKIIQSYNPNTIDQIHTQSSNHCAIRLNCNSWFFGLWRIVKKQTVRYKANVMSTGPLLQSKYDSMIAG